MAAIQPEGLWLITPEDVDSARYEHTKLQDVKTEANKYKVFGENYEPLSLALTIIITTVIIVVGAVLSDKLIPTSIYENPIHRITISRTGIILMSCAPLAVIIALAGCIWRDNKNHKWNEQNLARMADLKVVLRLDNPVFRREFNEYVANNSLIIPPEKLSLVVTAYEIYRKVQREITQIKEDLRRKEQEWFAESDAMEGESKMEGEGQEVPRRVSAIKVDLGNRARKLETLLHEKQDSLETSIAAIAAACVKEHTIDRPPSPINSPGSSPGSSVIVLPGESSSAAATISAAPPPVSQQKGGWFGLW